MNDVSVYALVLTLISVGATGCTEQDSRSPEQASTKEQSTPAQAAALTHVVKMHGVFYCKSKEALQDAWVEIDPGQEDLAPTTEWLAERGCGLLEKGEQVSIAARDGAMIRLTDGRWTSMLAVEPR